MKLGIVLAALIFFCSIGELHASLITIGTATYGGADYKMIWDDDNNGNSVVWLDYTHEELAWASQHAWAENLDSFLTYNLYNEYNVVWDESAWHLGKMISGPWWGYNVTSSELGHLYYEELGNLGYLDEAGDVNLEYGLQNTGPFEHLMETLYWGESSRVFYMVDGFLDGDPDWVRYQGVALRGGQVSTATPVFEPSAMLLFSLGLAVFGLGPCRRMGFRVETEK